MPKVIIHISGASGSGKTFLGGQLKELFGKKIIVKDLDILREEFIKKFYGDKKWTYIDTKEYQNFINAFIDKQTKPLVFVGLNDNRVFGKNKSLYYDLRSQHNYYIELDDMVVLEQKCSRLLNDIRNDAEAMRDLVKYNELFIKKFSQAVRRECNAQETIKINNEWKKDYIKQGYKLMSQENIFKTVSKILNDNIKTSS